MEEMRKSFHQDLEGAKSALVRMAASVIELIPRATQVLLDGDLEGAEQIIGGDEEIDQRAVDVEEHCMQILALQAPVASDLRQVIALMKMTADVERSGDLVANICKTARRIYGHDLDPRLRGVIARMGEQAKAIYEAAIEAYVENDESKAAAVDDMDAYLDGLQRQFVQTILECHSAGKIDLQVAVQLAIASRFYERIGDHAVHIAERVRFILTGWMPDHRKRPRPKVDLPPAGDGAA
ncbi:MAG: phosphate signaling complex protein PhoU [Ilumatobacteraceae bacterium]